jgi:HSP20 family protein
MAITNIITRRQGQNPIRALHDEMESLFDNFFHGFEIEPTGRRTQAFIPSLNVSEDDKHIEVTAELPGMDEKDIEVNVSNDFLTIKGEKKIEQEEKGKNYYRVERSFGSFHRAVPLSAEVDENKVQAAFKKGVLKITLPKKTPQQAQTKKIEIQSEK